MLKQKIEVLPNKILNFMFALWVATAPAEISAQGPVLPLDKVKSSDIPPQVFVDNGPNIFVHLAKKLVPSVVNISTLSSVSNPYGDSGDPFREFWEKFFGEQGPPGGPRGGGPGQDSPRSPKASSLGSGFIIDSSAGLILTNNHVVSNADEITVKFTEELDEVPTKAEVVGTDPELDLALIKVKTDRTLVQVDLGNSETLQVGEYVAAVGNPYGRGHSVTHGIISAKGRPAPGFALGSYLQTDAPINPGNSGGPLVNLKGEVIGINNAIDARAQGIGFAIPIDLVKAVLPQIKKAGTVTRGYIGVLVNDLTPEVAKQVGAPEDLKGTFVTHVYPNQPADKAGIKPYDVIFEFDGKKVTNPNTLVRAVVSVPIESTVPIKVNRAGKVKSLNIKVAKRPGTNQARAPKKKIQQRSKIDLGLEVENLSPDTARQFGIREDDGKGIVVSELAYEGPADNAGLKRGDVILEVDRKPVNDSEQFYALFKKKKSYLVRVRRPNPGGQDVFMVVILDLK